MRAGKGGLSLGVLSQEGNLDAEQSGIWEAELRGLQMTDLDERTDGTRSKCWFVDEESASCLLFQMKEVGPMGKKYILELLWIIWKNFLRLYSGWLNKVVACQCKKYSNRWSFYQTRSRIGKCSVKGQRTNTSGFVTLSLHGNYSCVPRNQEKVQIVGK